MKCIHKIQKALKPLTKVFKKSKPSNSKSTSAVDNVRPSPDHPALPSLNLGGDLDFNFQVEPCVQILDPVLPSDTTSSSATLLSNNSKCIDTVALAEAEPRVQVLSVAQHRPMPPFDVKSTDRYEVVTTPRLFNSAATTRIISSPVPSIATVFSGTSWTVPTPPAPSVQSVPFDSVAKLLWESVQSKEEVEKENVELRRQNLELQKRVESLTRENARLSSAKPDYDATPKASPPAAFSFKFIETRSDFEHFSPLPGSFSGLGITDSRSLLSSFPAPPQTVPSTLSSPPSPFERCSVSPSKMMASALSHLSLSSSPPPPPQPPFHEPVGNTVTFPSSSSQPERTTFRKPLRLRPPTVIRYKNKAPLDMPPPRLLRLRP